MVISQGTSTFLACFAGFWLLWALVVMLCCACSFLRRRIKRRRERHLREQCLRAMEMEPLDVRPSPLPPPPPPPAAPAPPLLPSPLPPPPRECPQFCPPQRLSPPEPLILPQSLQMPQAHWVTTPDIDAFGRPPCYEEAVLMEDPPPPYNEVLADPRGGTFLKPTHPLPLLPQRDPPTPHPPPPPSEGETAKHPAPLVVARERGYSSLIRLPSARRWDSLGHLLSNMDLAPMPVPEARYLRNPASAVATMPRRGARTPTAEGLGLGLNLGLRGGMGGIADGFHGVRDLGGLGGLEPSCGLPTMYPLLGRTTAV